MNLQFILVQTLKRVHIVNNYVRLRRQSDYNEPLLVRQLTLTGLVKDLDLNQLKEKENDCKLLHSCDDNDPSPTNKSHQVRAVSLWLCRKACLTTRR